VRRLANQVALALVAVLGLTSFAAAGATSKLPPTADCATIANGAHGPAVATLQRAVKATPDGDFGPLTAKAVSTWQKAHSLKQTGAVDAATWKALPVAVAASACGQPVSASGSPAGTGVTTSCTTLQTGAVGPAVGVLQTVLKVTVDRAFGPQTRAAVLAAQQRLKLPRTGVVDAATWAALGRTGTPACVSTSSTVKVVDVTPAPTPTTPAPPPSANAIAQAKIKAQVVALAAKLPSMPGTSTDQVALKALAFAKSQTGKPY
jgi:peptidoglycan hydrolase-like protein with peptidoglycan-binding domain